MQIICVRHGEACGPEVDGKRSLTEKGQAQVERIACFLAKNGVFVQQLFHSRKERAQQTADIFTKKLAIPVSSPLSLLGDEQEDSVARLLDMMPHWVEDTLIVGHLPFLPQFINALVLGDINILPLSITLPPQLCV
jgi:phosphohistidine phosphatase